MAADPAWVTELSLTENDAIRVASDNVQQVIAKYNAPAGAAVWVDAEQGAYLTIVNEARTGAEDWLGGLTTAQRNAFLDTHTVDGMVTLSAPATRSALNGFLDAAQVAAVTTAYETPGQTLYQSKGLANVGKQGIYDALKEISDTPQYAEQQRGDAIKSIETKWRDRAVRDATSLVNLQTIDSLIGVA